MADSQGNTSTSSDRMIIDLGFSSEGDAGNEASASTASETDVETQRSPTRKVDSEHQSELLSADGIDLVEDIFHRTERSETVEKIGSNSDCDDQDVSQDESNPFDLQETDNDNGRNDDSDTDSRLVIEEKSEDCHKATDRTEDKGEGGEKETVSENLVISSRHIDKIEEEMGDDKDITSKGGTCSVEHIERTGEEERGEQVVVSQQAKNSSGHGEKRQNEVGDEKCIVSSRETCAPKHCEGPEGEVLLQSETCPSEHSETMEEDTGDEREAVLRRVTRSPEHSLQYELSETFLDNLNPQDDSQDLTEEEEAVSQVEEEDEKGAGPGSSVPSLVHTETDVDTEDEKEAVSHAVTHSPNLSLQFELSETFLDNLNPQDDSQCEEELEETDKNEHQRTTEEMEEDGDEQKASVSERQMSVPDYGDQFELSETFLDNLNPQDDSQDLDEMNESESEQVGKGTDRCDASSPQRRKDSSEDEACHLLEPVTEVDSTSPCTEKISSTGEGFSAHCDQHTNISSPQIQQDTSLCEASSSSIQAARCAGTAVSPRAQQNSSRNETGSSHDEQLSPVNQSSCDHQVSVSCEMLCHPVQPNSCEGDDDSSPCAQTKTTKVDDSCISQDQTVVMKESDGGKIVASTTAVQNSPPHGQEDGASCAVEGVAVDKDSSHKVEPSIITGKASPSPADQDATTHDSSLDAEECSSEKNSEKGNEGTALHSSVDKEQELPASEEKDQETATKEVDAREEGEYSSSPSSPSEPGDDQDGNTSDVLHLSADDLEMEEEDSDNKKSVKENCRNGKDGSQGDVSVNRDPLQSSPRQHGNHSEVSDSAPLVEEVNSSGEVDSRQGQERLNKEKSETREKIHSEEDGIDIIETGVDLDDRDDNIVPLDSPMEGTPAEGVTQVTQRDEGEKKDGGEDPKTLQTNEDDSDDDVQIIECPPQEPIDTLIVDDDDDDDIVPSNSVSSKTTVCEPSRTSKKKRTVEQDGHDLRIVIRDERREKDDSDRHHKRHERDRRDERRPDSYRRSESDRKSSDHSSRRRHHRSRSHSRERRRKRSRSRSQSPDRSSRRRRHRDRSRDRSAERERSSHRKRRRDRSHERRHRSRSRSRSQKHRREDSWDKENRNDRELAERRSKRNRHNRDEDRRDKSPEEQSSAKREDSPVPQPPKKSNLKQSDTWKPSDTFLKDPSDSPSTVHSVAEKSNDESDASVEEVVQCEVLTEKKEELVVVPEKETEVTPMDIPMPGPQDIIFLKPEDIPIPTTETVSLPKPFDIPVPLPPLVPEHAPVPIMMPPPPFFENPPLPPVPEEEPMENPPEPPPLPPRWPEAMPTKGEGLLPTPIRRKAALEEAAAAAVYDPAHPTDEEGERFRFPGMPNSARPPPEMMGGPPPPEMMGGPPPPEMMGGPPPPEMMGGPPPPEMMGGPPPPEMMGGPPPPEMMGGPPPPEMMGGPPPPEMMGGPPPPEMMGGPPPPEMMGGPPPPEMMGGPPPPEIIGGPPPPPRLPGQMRSDGTFVVPAPGEGGLLGPPPPRVPMQPRFGPPRPMMMNRMVLDRPPFNNGPFPNQPRGPPPPPGFRMEMGGPGGAMPLQNQFGQGPPPPGPPPGPPGPHGPPGPPQGFPGPLNDNFEDGPPRPPVGQFPVSVHSGMPEMTSMPPPPGLPPPDLPLMSHPPPLDMTIQDNGIADNKFDKTLASLVAPQNLLTVMNDHKIEVESTSVPPPSVFKVPPPPLEHQAKSPNHFHLSVEAPVDVEQSEDSTEVMDMDMSPMDEDCEPMHSADIPAKEADKKPKPLTAIDLKAISNALLKLTSAAADDLPTSAVELTNKEKYMKKLHLQERVVDEVKQALRPFYSHKKIDKEEYKTILRKAVPKVCHSKSGDINPQKIQQLVEGYVSKFQKQRQYGEQKIKPSKTEVPAEKGKANGERAKPAR